MRVQAPEYLPCSAVFVQISGTQQAAAAAAGVVETAAAMFNFRGNSSRVGTAAALLVSTTGELSALRSS